jgi:gas vesicle protein
MLLKEAKMRKTVYLIIGLLAGAAVGAATAILLAPYSGHEMQSRIRTHAQELIEEGKKAAAARRAELQAQLESFKRGTSVTIDKTTSDQPPA